MTLGTDPVVMGDGELDGVDAGEISGVERVLAPRPPLRFLAEHSGQGMRYRIEDGDRGDAAAARLLLELAADIAVHQRKEDEARPPLDIVEHTVEMPFRAHHRPEMLQHFDMVELGEAGLGDQLQRLSGRVGNQVDVEISRKARGIGHRRNIDPESAVRIRLTKS